MINTSCLANMSSVIRAISTCGRLRIVVYDVAAESGGALTVLKDYYNRAVEDRENDYLFIVSVVQLNEAPNVRIVYAPNVKRSWASRIAFDVFKAHQIINEFDADIVLSLQNTTVPLTKRQQVVLMHNLLPRPICDIRFSIKDEPLMWVYQNIIGQVIIRSLKKADGVIVQAEWLRRRLSDRCNINKKKVIVERPVIPKRKTREERSISQPYCFFYPASSAPFKNHETILEACNYLAANGVNNFRVVLTLEGNENKRAASLLKAAEANALPIIFRGWLNEDEINKCYLASDCLLFPSKLETFGLPLAEASSYGMNVIAADLEYAHETLNGYDHAKFFPCEDAKALAEIMKDAIYAHD